CSYSHVLASHVFACICICLFSFFFFFSSRRRHTRSKRDWSSDVCSSDLPKMLIVVRKPGVRGLLINIFGGITRCDDIARGIVDRSEERRVGKECRARGWPDH